MQQFSLHLTDHVAIVAEILTNAPDFGPGDRVLVADGGVKSVFIDTISSYKGENYYECHDDSDTPIKRYYHLDELFGTDEAAQCKKVWDALESGYESIVPEDIGFEKKVSFDYFLAKPYLRNRGGSVNYSLMNNGLIYNADLEAYVKTENVDDPIAFIDEKVNRLNRIVEENHGFMFEKRNPIYKKLYRIDDTFVEWENLKNWSGNVSQRRLELSRAVKSA